MLTHWVSGAYTQCLANSLPTVLLSLPLSVGIIGVYFKPGLAHGCWGCELRSSWVYFTTAWAREWNYSLSLFFLLKNWKRNKIAQYNPAVIWMRVAPIRLLYLNVCSLDGRTIWEGVLLLEVLCHWRLTVLEVLVNSWLILLILGLWQGSISKNRSPVVHLIESRKSKKIDLIGKHATTTLLNQYNP